MSTKLHRIGTVTPRSHLRVKTPWVRSLLTMSRTSERTGNPRKLLGCRTTHLHISSPTAAKKRIPWFTWFCSQQAGRDQKRSPSTLHGLQISEVASWGAHKLSATPSPQKGQRKHHHRRSDEHCNGNRPEKDWPDDQILVRHLSLSAF